MAYALQPDEPVAAGLRRIITELTDHSIAQIDGTTGVDERVHEVRKALKKTRAALRLARAALPQFDRENARYRDAGRCLSSLRDASAMIETVDKLASELTEAAGPGTPDALRDVLISQRDLAFDTDIDHAFAEVRQRLTHSRIATRSLEFDADGFTAIGAGLRRSYRRARKLHTSLQKGGDTEAFHTWRKRLKYHRYHVEILQGLWTEGSSPTPGLHELTDYLGMANDVAVLLDNVDTFSEPIVDRSTDAKIRSSLVIVRDTARSSAVELGSELLSQTPSEMVRRTQERWNDWYGRG